jgi:hypothetical protein
MKKNIDFYFFGVHILLLISLLHFSRLAASLRPELRAAGGSKIDGGLPPSSTLVATSLPP